MLVSPVASTHARPRIPTVTEINHVANTEGLAGLRHSRDEFKQVVDALNREARAGGIPDKKLADMNNTLIRYEEKILRMEIERAKLPPQAANRSTPHQQEVFNRLMELCDPEVQMKAIDEFMRLIEDHVLTLEFNEETGECRVRKATEAEKLRDLAFGICGGMPVSQR